MNDAALTPDELNEVNRLINLFMAGDIADPSGARLAVQQTAVLPALEDWSAFGGISRAGGIVRVNRDAPFATRPIDRARIQRFVLFEASRRYSSLLSLKPARPPEAPDCPTCRGTGRVSHGIQQETIRIAGRERSVRELDDGLGCFCGGLGWVLDSELGSTDT